MSTYANSSAPQVIATPDQHRAAADECMESSQSHDDVQEAFVSLDTRRDHTGAKSSLSLTFVVRRLSKQDGNLQDEQTTNDLLAVVESVGLAIRTTFEEGVHMFADSAIPQSTLQNFSVVALLLHLLLDRLAALVQETTEKLNFGSWMIYAFAGIGTLSLVTSLMLHCQPSQVTIFCGMAVLFLLECLVPLSMAGCIVLFFTGAMSLLDAVFVCTCMMAVSNAGSWTVRRVLYTCLGHG